METTISTQNGLAIREASAKIVFSCAFPSPDSDTDGLLSGESECAPSPRLRQPVAIFGFEKVQE
jgi:hypothetical protein